MKDQHKEDKPKDGGTPVAGQFREHIQGNDGRVEDIK